MVRNKILLAGSVLLILVILIGCGGVPRAKSPKEAVIMMFGAMERDDKAALAHLLDLPSLMGVEVEDYALKADKPRIFHSPEDLLNDLTGEGKTKNRWFAYQRIVGVTEVTGDSATVEVSFIDKDKTNATQYLSKFGLVKRSDVWKIYSFRKND